MLCTTTCCVYCILCVSLFICFVTNNNNYIDRQNKIPLQTAMYVTNTKTKKTIIQSLAMDVLAPSLMKNAVKCDR